MPKATLALAVGNDLHGSRDTINKVVYAEQLGFSTVWLIDHFVPWIHDREKKAPFVWAQIAASLERTSKVKMGTQVTTPIGGRYHPALIAQAAATIGEMHPGRFILGVGSGEAINETLFFGAMGWPNWQGRIERLTEAVDLIRRLWEAKEPFKFKGKYFGSDFYFLYTKPKKRIPIYVAAIGRKAAFFAGRYGDSLLTAHHAPKRLSDEILPSYREGCAATHRSPGVISYTIDFSFMRSSTLTRESKRLLSHLADGAVNLKNPVEVAKRGEKITLQDLKKESMYFCQGWGDLVKIIEDYVKVGVTDFTIGTSQRKEMKACYDNVLSVL